MFDLGWPELLVIAIVALVVVGPKDLPNVLRTIMGLMRKVRGLSREFQRSLAELARETGVDEIKRDLERTANVKGELAGVFEAETFAGKPSDAMDAAGDNRIEDPAAAKKRAAIAKASGGDGADGASPAGQDTTAAAAGAGAATGAGSATGPRREANGETPPPADTAAGSVDGKAVDSADDTAAAEEVVAAPAQAPVKGAETKAPAGAGTGTA